MDGKVLATICKSDLVFPIYEMVCPHLLKSSLKESSLFLMMMMMMMMKRMELSWSSF